MTPRSRDDHQKHAFKQLNDAANSSAHIVCGTPSDATGVDPVRVTQVADTSGTTEQFTDTATVVVDDFSDTKAITSFLIINQEFKNGNIIEFSLDDGTSWTRVFGGGFIGYPPKGDVLNIKVRRNAAASLDTSYDLIINRKA